jgi:hypothetical protein
MGLTLGELEEKLRASSHEDACRDEFVRFGDPSEFLRHRRLLW